MEKEKKFLNKKRNLKNNSSNNNIKKDLMTFKELKIKAKKMIKKAKTIQELKNCIKIYDVCEDINLQYLKSIYKIDIKECYNEFIKYQYTLAYNERVQFMKRYKKNLLKVQKKYSKDFIYCQEEKLENVFFNLLKYMIEENNLNLMNLYNKFCTTFYVETLAFNIPIIYGNSELFFSYLINAFYNFFIINKSYPILSLDDNININNIRIKKRKSSMIMKMKSIKKNNTNENENKPTEIPQEYLTNIDNNFSTKDNNLFVFKCATIMPLIKKYISNDFQNDLKKLLKSLRGLKERKRIKYNFLSFFEIFQYLLVKLNKSPEEIELNNLYDFFYEGKEDKLDSLKKMKSLLNINFYYIDNKLIDLNNFKIENEDYYIEINNVKYIINFNNFILKRLCHDMVSIIKGKYEICLNNIRNYSLQGCIINNRCFNNKNLFDFFQKDIDDTLNNTTLEEVFNCIIPFNNYKYPFYQKKFREQVKEVILFIPFINNNILGLTLRNLGIIVLNKNIFHLVGSNKINKEYPVSLIKSCFAKVTFLHESNFHYLLKICSSQDEEIACKTPYKYYKNYTFKKKELENSKEYDGGDFGEALIFGEKLYEIFLPGVERILSKSFWEKKNIDFPKLGTEFIKLNIKNKIFQKDLRKISDYTNTLYDVTIKEIQNYSNSIDYTPINLGDLSVRMRSTDKGMIIEDQNIGEISIKFDRNIRDVVD